MKFKIYTEEDREAVKAYIDKLPSGKAYTAEITKKQSKRSIDQNRLYWLWLNCIAKDGEMGYTADELHLVFVQKFLGARHREMYGEQVLDTPSTRKLSAEQFTDYLNRIEVFANTELDIQLPRPEDRYFEQFYDTYKDMI